MISTIYSNRSLTEVERDRGRELGRPGAVTALAGAPDASGTPAIVAPVLPDLHSTSCCVESAACCATANLAPAATQAMGEQSHIDGDLLLVSLHAPWTTIHTADIEDFSVYRWSGSDPPDIPSDSSLTYLQTSRLRL